VSTRKQTNERGDLMMDTCSMYYTHIHVHGFCGVTRYKVEKMVHVEVEDRVRDVYVCESR